MIAYSTTQIARGFIKLMDKYPRKKLIGALAQELVRHRRQRAAEIVVHQIARQLLLQRRHLLAEVVSAHPLPAAVKKQVSNFLKNQSGATEISLRTRLDPALLGGVIVRAPGLELDASAVRTLNRLAIL